VTGDALEDRLVAAFRQLGLARSDARLYLALLKKNPATGYELAASSGVARAAIYHTLGRLEKGGLVQVVQHKPARYQPIAPERLLELLEVRLQQDLEQLRRGLERLAPEGDEEPTWNITGYQSLLEQARALIGSCRHSLHLSLWRREAEALAGQLRQARQRGRRVVLFSFTSLPRGLGRVLSYGIDEQQLEQHWAHKLILVADRRRALLGGAEQREDNQALYTQEPVLVEMAISNLVLDITLYGQRFGKNVSRVVSGLTRHLAPVEKLIAGRDC